MRPQPPGVRRRQARCRCADRYMVLAVFAFVGFVMSVSLVSQSIEERIRSSFAEQARERAEAATGGDAIISPAPAMTWSPSVINGVELTRRGLEHVKTALQDAEALFGMESSLVGGLLDVALLVRAREPEGVEDVVERFTSAAITGATSAGALAEAAEAIDGVQVALRVRGYGEAADVCEQQRRRLVRERATDVAAAPAALAWAFDRHPAVDHPRTVAADVTPSPATALQVDRLEYLLNNWIVMGGARNESAAPLRAAYAAVVSGAVRDLFHTARTRTGNYTFVPTQASGVIYPRLCGLPAVLSRGARHNAHPSSSDEGDRAELTSEQVLQAAEALAATCLLFYADARTHYFDAPLRYIHVGPDVPERLPFRPVSAGDGSHDECKMPLLLMRSFYELFEYTQDPVYAAWASYVMSGDAHHCAMVTDDGRGVGLQASRRYAAELRYFTLLLLSLECNLYRGAVGTRGVCQLRSNVLLSPDHHLVALPTA